MADLVEQKVKGLQCTVLEVKNQFFGETVNCSGLLVGQDIINAIKQSNIDYDYIVLPCSMLKDGEIFLDGVTLNEFKEKLNKTIVTDGSGESFVLALTKPNGEYYE